MVFLKKILIVGACVLLSGCIQSTALLGPSFTVATTGNIPQAGLQYIANETIKKETGKDALMHVKEIVEEENRNRKFKRDFKSMVENRIKNARKKIIMN
jgi:hypothetical protein